MEFHAPIRRSPAVKAYFVNLMWQPRRNDELSGPRTMSERSTAHAGKGLLDYAGREYRVGFAPALRKKYASQQVKPVEVDLDELNAPRPAGPSLETCCTNRPLSDTIRRPSAAVALRLAQEGRQRRLKD